MLASAQASAHRQSSSDVAALELSPASLALRSDDASDTSSSGLFTTAETMP